MLYPAILSTSTESTNIGNGHTKLDDFLSEYHFNSPDADHTIFFPLFMAVTEGNIEIVSALLEDHADPHQRLLGVGTSCLEAAAVMGNTEVCKLLIHADAEVDSFSQLNGAGALDKAAQGGQVETVRYLVSCGAKLDIRRTDKLTPLMTAAAKGRRSVVEALIKLKADPHQEADGKRAVDFAADGKHREVVVLLQETTKDKKY